MDVIPELKDFADTRPDNQYLQGIKDDNLTGNKAIRLSYLLTVPGKKMIEEVMEIKYKLNNLLHRVSVSPQGQCSQADLDEIVSLFRRKIQIMVKTNGISLESIYNEICLQNANELKLNKIVVEIMNKLEKNIK